MQKVIFAAFTMLAALRWRPLSSISLQIREKAEAISAGTEPGLRVHPEVLTVMQESGIDLSDTKPQKLTQDLANDAAPLITTGYRSGERLVTIQHGALS